MKKILIVEDDLVSHIILKRSFEDVIITFSINGCDGLTKFQQDNYDVVLTDVYLPLMNGDVLASKIKTLQPNQTIVGMSGCSEYKDCKFFDYFIEKPFTYSKLQELKSIIGCK